MLIFTALRDIAKGDEVLISYAESVTNYEVFYTYGFMLENNPEDKALIQLCLDGNAPENQVKISQIEEFFYLQTFEVKGNLNEEMSNRMIAFSRFITAQEKTIQRQEL